MECVQVGVVEFAKVSAHNGTRIPIHVSAALHPVAASDDYFKKPCDKTVYPFLALPKLDLIDALRAREPSASSGDMAYSADSACVPAKILFLTSLPKPSVLTLFLLSNPLSPSLASSRAEPNHPPPYLARLLLASALAST